MSLTPEEARVLLKLLDKTYGIPLTDDRDTFPRICPHCMTVITSRGSHAGDDGYSLCVGYGYGTRSVSDPLGVITALRALALKSEQD